MKQHTSARNVQLHFLLSSSYSVAATYGSHTDRITGRSAMTMTVDAAAEVNAHTLWNVFRCRFTRGEAPTPASDATERNAMPFHSVASIIGIISMAHTVHTTDTHTTGERNRPAVADMLAGILLLIMHETDRYTTAVSAAMSVMTTVIAPAFRDSL